MKGKERTPSYEELYETCRLYAENQMRKVTAANMLHVKAETVDRRFRRIKRTTGYDPYNFYDLYKILTNKEVLWSAEL